MDAPGRYATLAIREEHRPDGTVQRYRARRFVPRTEPGASPVHVSGGDERLDRLAASHLGDPAAWWMIADRNAILEPAILERRAGYPIRLPRPGSTP